MRILDNFGTFTRVYTEIEGQGTPGMCLQWHSFTCGSPRAPNAKPGDEPRPNQRLRSAFDEACGPSAAGCWVLKGSSNGTLEIFFLFVDNTVT